MKNYTKVNLTSSDLSLEKQEELRRILPEAFSEDKIDWEKLCTVLGDSVDERVEKFNFSWAGKGDAINSVLTPSKGTLRADKDESIKFDESENLFIEGDNLEVLKLLQKTYFERVKMIYIDPPYNTGGDFVYRDNFVAPLKGYLQQTGQVDSEGNNLQTNKETSGRFHSDWLSMMYPRIKLAWNLLKDDGVIFVSIDDNEMHHLRMVMDEIFGGENFVGTIAWESKTKSQNTETAFNKLQPKVEYILLYTKRDGRRFNLVKVGEKEYPHTDDNGIYREYALEMMNVEGVRGRETMVFEIEGVNPSKGKQWKLGKDTIQEYKDRGDLFIRDGSVVLKKRPEDEKFDVSQPFWGFFSKEIGTTESAKKELSAILDKHGFETVKPLSLIQKLIFHSTDKSDLILDFFAGSGTTAQAVLKQNQDDGGSRKFILVQLPEATDVESEAYRAGYKTIADISKERIRRVINGYGDKPQPIDDGFKVFKLGESNYPENQFEFDPEKSEEENKKAFDAYLAKAKQVSLFDEVNASDVIYENIVKEGFSLNAKITVSKIAENTVSIVSDGEMQFLICLDKKINDAAIRALTETEYKGKTFICFDSALDDTAKANLGLNIELKTI